MDHPTDDKSSSETCVAGVRSAEVGGEVGNSDQIGGRGKCDNAGNCFYSG